MTSSEVRLAETIEIFFQAADLSSDGAMAGHAYKRAVDELDTGVGRDLVSFVHSRPWRDLTSWLWLTLITVDAF